MEAEKSKIKVPEDLESSEGPLPGLQMTMFLLYPHRAERVLVSFSSSKGINPIRGVLLIDLI